MICEPGRRWRKEDWEFKGILRDAVSWRPEILFLKSYSYGIRMGFAYWFWLFPEKQECRF